MLGVPYTARAMGGSEKAGAPPVGAVGSAEADESVIFNAEPQISSAESASSPASPRS